MYSRPLFLRSENFLKYHINSGNCVEIFLQFWQYAIKRDIFGGKQYRNNGRTNSGLIYVGPDEGRQEVSGTNERAKTLEATIADFRMFDDTFMSAVFDGKKEETEFLINVILERNDIVVKESKAQFFMSNIYGRGVRLDIQALDLKGNAYHFEVERSKGRASVQRARFTGAMVDSRLLRKGQGFREIPERYTIFITEEDFFEAGLPLYHAENKVAELDNAPLGDGGHIIYVNGAYNNTDDHIG